VFIFTQSLRPLSNATNRRSDDVAHLTRPRGQISERDGRELTNPDGQQTSVQDQSVGDRHHHQEEVGRELQHGLVVGPTPGLEMRPSVGPVAVQLKHGLVAQDGKREDISERSEDDDERRNVQLEETVSSIFTQLCHLLQQQQRDLPPLRSRHHMGAIYISSFMSSQTSKTADYGCSWVYGCRPKSVSAGLSCGLAERRPCL